MYRAMFAAVALLGATGALAEDPIGVTPPVGSANTVTCRHYAVTGSNAKTTRVCLTGTEWQARSQRPLYGGLGAITLPNIGFYAGSVSVPSGIGVGR